MQILATMEKAESSSRFLIQDRTTIGMIRMAIQVRRLRWMLKAELKIYIHATTTIAIKKINQRSIPSARKAYYYSRKSQLLKHAWLRAGWVLYRSINLQGFWLICSTETQKVRPTTGII